ncbi:hypothetical protein GT755_17635 [Herbidospora sp. NEAU-GS84]|uniref:Uncharacterized protein n=1 Tax=Herbidospora solisilvae TaxID=2696284 RepID=A0A7C9N289_9ACTN|nr:hypothetical protein [Herbidospora solisilvae]NAS23509.1 hypothetical protein [Herbidospora solisilvae]
MRHTWIGQPLTVLAMVVLVVNDHVLKAAWPGLVTGKLSDVAGLVLFPALLDLVVGRAKVSIAVTGVGFTLVKTTATGAWLASEAWTAVWGPSKVLADPTDLLALPALWAAWWAYRHPVSVHKAVVFLVVPPAVLAVAATSAAEYDWPYSAYAVEAAGDEIVVHTKGGYGMGDDLISYRTRDGIAWDKWIQNGWAERTPRDCHGAACFRVMRGHLRVEEIRGGRWTTVWEIPDEARDRLVRRHPDPPFGHPEPVESLAVAVTERLVVVANGADGIALRDAQGAWHRLGVGPDGLRASSAVPLTTPGRYDVTDLVALGALAAALLALLAGARNWPIVIGGAVLLLGLRFGLSMVDSTLGFLGMPPALLLMVAGTGLLSWGISRAGPPWRLIVVSLVTGLVAGSAVLAPYAAWSAGALDFYTDAGRAALAAFTLVTAAGMVTGYLKGGRR